MKTPQTILFKNKRRAGSSRGSDRRGTFWLGAVALALYGSSAAHAQTVYTYSTTTTSATYVTPGNWTTGGVTSTKFPGDAGGSTVVANEGTSTDIAAFGAVTSSAATILLNFNTLKTSLSLGAIDFLSTTTRNIVLGDNSSTPATATLTLNGQTLDSIANTVLVNDGAYSMTLEPAAASGSTPMTVALGNATNNVVQVNSTGGTEISSVVSGGKLTVTSAGTGAFTLSAPTGNTYTGGTTITQGKLVVTNTSGSGTGTAAVAVGNGTAAATLAGNGIITGAVTTTSSSATSNLANISPGVNTGTTNFGVAGTLTLKGGLSVGNNTNFNFDLASTTTGTSDQVALGSSSLSLGNAVTFNFNLLTANTLATAGSYTLISGSSSALSLSGVTFTTTGLPSSYTANYSVSGGNLLVSFATAASGNYFGTTGQGVNPGSTVFDTTTQDFNTKNDGSGTAHAYDPTQVAIFGGTSGTVTVASGGVTVGSGLQFDSSGYVLTGGQLTLTANNVQVTNSTDTATINSAITGTAGLNKAGAGKLILTGADTVTGTFTNSAGTLEFNNGVNALSALTVSGGTAQIDSGSQVTLTSGTSLTVSSGAALNINGTLLNNSTTALPGSGGTITVASGGTVIQQGNGSPTAFLFSGSSPAVFQPGSTFVFRDYTASPSVSNRTYTGNLTFDNSGTPNTVGAISGAGAWTVNGDLTIGAGTGFDYGTYTGTTTFSGNVTVNGSLGVNNGARSFTIANGKTLTLGSAGSVTLASGQIITVNSGGTLLGTGSISGGSTIVSGTLAPATIGTVGTITTGALTLASTSTLAFDINSTTSKDLVALNTAALTLNGGTLALTLPNTTSTGIDYTATYVLASGVSSVSGTGFGNVTGYDSTDFAPVFNLVGANYDLTFTPVPEPASILGGALLMGAAGWNQRRRLRRMLKCI